MRIYSKFCLNEIMKYYEHNLHLYYLLSLSNINLFIKTIYTYIT